MYHKSGKSGGRKPVEDRSEWQLKMLCNIPEGYWKVHRREEHKQRD